MDERDQQKKPCRTPKRTKTSQNVCHNSCANCCTWETCDRLKSSVLAMLDCHYKERNAIGCPNFKAFKGCVCVIMTWIISDQLTVKAMGGSRYISTSF